MRSTSKPLYRFYLTHSFAVGIAVLLAVALSWSHLLSLSVSSDHGESEGASRAVRNLGELEPGERVDDHFMLTNASEVPWTLKRVLSDCGCLVHDLDWRTIQPGHSEAVRMQFIAPQSSGKVKRQLLLEFQEKNVPPQTIHIISDVVPWCRFIPPKVAFSGVSADATSDVLTQNVRLLVRPGSAINTTYSPAMPPWLSIKFLSNHANSASNKEEVVEASIQIRPDQLPRQNETIVHSLVAIESASRDKTFNLPIQVVLTAPLSSDPKSLFLGNRKPGESFTKLLRIRRADPGFLAGDAYIGGELQVEHSFGDHLEIRMESEQNGKVAVIHCCFAMPFSAQFIAGAVKVSENNRRPLVIPVTARIVPCVGLSE